MYFGIQKFEAKFPIQFENRIPATNPAQAGLTQSHEAAEVLFWVLT